jgi:hypothetical protein
MLAGVPVIASLLNEPPHCYKGAFVTPRPFSAVLGSPSVMLGTYFLGLVIALNISDCIKH